MNERVIPFREIVVAAGALTIRSLMDLRSTLQRLEDKGWLEQADHPDGLAFRFTERGLKQVRGFVIKMKNYCNYCGKIAEVENWGVAGYLCSDCIKEFKKAIPSKPKNNPEVVFDEPQFNMGNASYNLETNNITIRGYTESVVRMITWISHEFVHFLLHRDEGIKTTFQYDNVSGQGQFDYPITVCDERR